MLSEFWNSIRLFPIKITEITELQNSSIFLRSEIKKNCKLVNTLLNLIIQYVSHWVLKFLSITALRAILINLKLQHLTGLSEPIWTKPVNLLIRILTLLDPIRYIFMHTWSFYSSHCKILFDANSKTINKYYSVQNIFHYDSN